jgi:hypothetical protein
MSSIDNSFSLLILITTRNSLFHDMERVVKNLYSFTLINNEEEISFKMDTTNKINCHKEINFISIATI